MQFPKSLRASREKYQSRNDLKFVAVQMYKNVRLNSESLQPGLMGDVCVCVEDKHLILIIYCY